MVKETATEQPPEKKSQYTVLLLDLARAVGV